MNLHMKKKFVTPRVIQEVQIHLEHDLLARSADDMTGTTDGQYFEDTNYGDDQDWTSE